MLHCKNPIQLSRRHVNAPYRVWYLPIAWFRLVAGCCRIAERRDRKFPISPQKCNWQCAPLQLSRRHVNAPYRVWCLPKAWFRLVAGCCRTEVDCSNAEIGYFQSLRRNATDYHRSQQIHSILWTNLNTDKLQRFRFSNVSNYLTWSKPGLFQAEQFLH